MGAGGSVGEPVCNAAKKWDESPDTLEAVALKYCSALYHEYVKKEGGSTGEFFDKELDEDQINALDAGGYEKRVIDADGGADAEIEIVHIAYEFGYAAGCREWKDGNKFDERFDTGTSKKYLAAMKSKFINDVEDQYDEVMGGLDSIQVQMLKARAFESSMCDSDSKSERLHKVAYDLGRMRSGVPKQMLIAYADALRREYIYMEDGKVGSVFDDMFSPWQIEALDAGGFENRMKESEDPEATILDIATELGLYNGSGRPAFRETVGLLYLKALSEEWVTKEKEGAVGKLFDEGAEWHNKVYKVKEEEIEALDSAGYEQRVKDDGEGAFETIHEEFDRMFHW